MNRLFLLLLGVFLFSCSESDDFVLNGEAEVAPQISTRALPHQDYKELGWGIDLTGDYLSLGAIKGAVIDVTKFEKDFPDRIIAKPDQRYAHQEIYYGSSATEYLKDISTSWTNNNKDIASGAELFTSTMTANYKDKMLYTSEYSFISLNVYVSVGKTYFIEKNPITLSKYLAAGFIYSLNINSASELVKEYGTHVVLDITLGGKLTILYKSEVVKTTKDETISAGLSDVQSQIGLGGSNTSVNTKLVQNNTNASVRIVSTGGMSSVTLTWNFNGGPLKDISLADWDKSLTYKNSNTSEVNYIIPIYELITDPTKKAQVKAAVEKYIADRQLELLYPMYGYWSNSRKDHHYTIDPFELKGREGASSYAFENIACYIYNTQMPGTVPLYRYWNDSRKDHLFTTDLTELNGTIGKSGYAFEKIAGYVYKTQVANTVPLYRYWNGSRRDHHYTANPNELNGTSGKGDYKFEYIAGYVYK